MMKFARQYALPLISVINDEGGQPADVTTAAYIERGTLTNSGTYDGLAFEDAFEKIASALEEKSLGKVTTQYRLRDWGVSRQRYWGTPIPMLNLEGGGEVPIPAGWRGVTHKDRSQLA